MSAPTGALQTAVFAALSADAALATLLGGTQIHDTPPRNAATPYLHLGEMSARDWSTGTDQGVEITFAVVAWSRREGRSQALAIADRARAVLHDAALTLAGCRLVNLRHTGTETARVEKPAGRRVVARFRAVIETA